MDRTSKMRSIWLYAELQPALAAATQLASRLAEASGAAVTMVNVLETVQHPLLLTSTGRELVRLLEEVREERFEAVHRELRERLASPRAERLLLQGDVAWHTVTRHVVQRKPDLLVVPADEGTRTGPFGSLTQHLFRKCPAPVLAVLPELTRLPRRVLVAVDSGAEDSDERLLSREVLRQVMSLPNAARAELHVVHAWDLWGEELIEARYGAVALTSYMDQERRFAEDWTEQLLAEAGCTGAVHAVHHPKGHAGLAVPTLARKLGVDLVVLGSAARRGLRGFLMGSVAETILNQLRCSALVVKRPGFVSPVSDETTRWATCRD